MTNQSNFFVDKSVIPSPDPSLKHQIIHGKINLSIPSPPPHKRVVWDYSQAHMLAIKDKVINTPWQQMFQNQTPESCIDIFTFRFMCIIESNIPNKTVTVDDRDDPWIQPTLKNLIKKNRKIYSDCKKAERRPHAMKKSKLTNN